jgi:hypothetical protein
MKYYSYSASLASTYRKPAKPRSPIVLRELVPKTINALDVLLSIWIAEAVLETEPPKRRSGRKATRRRTASAGPTIAPIP